MRDYYLKTSEIPEELYRQTLWMIKGYDRMKEEYDNAIWDSPEPPDGQPRGSNTGDPTSREGMKRAELFRKLQAIEQAKISIPNDYREGVWNNVLYKVPYPRAGHRSTWWHHKAAFIRRVAENMYWL